MSNQTISEAAVDKIITFCWEKFGFKIGHPTTRRELKEIIQSALDAAARVEPTDKWEIHFERKNTDTNQDEFSIECAGKPVMHFLWTLPQAEAICAARDASLPATPTPQGETSVETGLAWENLADSYAWKPFKRDNDRSAIYDGKANYIASMPTSVAEEICRKQSGGIMMLASVLSSRSEALISSRSTKSTDTVREEKADVSQPQVAEGKEERQQSGWIKTADRPPTKEDGEWILVFNASILEADIKKADRHHNAVRWPFWMPIPPVPVEGQQKDLG